MNQPKTLVVAVGVLTAVFVGLLLLLRGTTGNVVPRAPVGGAPPAPAHDPHRAAPRRPAASATVSLPATVHSDSRAEQGTGDNSRIGSSDQPSPAEVQNLIDAMAAEIEHADSELQLDIDGLRYELDAIQSTTDLAELASQTDLEDALRD